VQLSPSNKEDFMNVTITGVFDSATKVKGAEDDLRSTGIPREKIYVDASAMTIKVITPETSKPEILELLGRHSPVDVS
jgi:hypothetical protein